MKDLGGLERFAELEQYFMCKLLSIIYDHDQ